MLSEAEAIHETQSADGLKDSATDLMSQSPAGIEAADTSTYKLNDPHRHALKGNGLGFTIWPDRLGGLGQLYDGLKPAAVRLWVDYFPADPDKGGPFVPDCAGANAVNMEAYWKSFPKDKAENVRTAAGTADSMNADVLIVIKYPPPEWRNLIRDSDGKVIASTMKDNCEGAMAYFWGAAVKHFKVDLGIPFSTIELFNEPRYATRSIASATAVPKKHLPSHGRPHVIRH
jgi:hypothetical protein